MGCTSSSLCEELPPRVVVDNLVSTTDTLIRVERRKHVLLLKAVQKFSDLNLSINKAFISSDNGLFMDVFHLTDQDGSKLSGNIVNYIQHSLRTKNTQTSEDNQGLAELQVTGTDQTGLLSEVFTVIADLQGNVVDAKFWTHNSHYALLIYFIYEDSGSTLSESQKVSRIEDQLTKVLKGSHKVRAARTHKSLSVTNMERRLHQLLFAGRDYEHSPPSDSRTSPWTVSVEDSWVRGYSVVKVECKDRQKLLFDIVCTLMDMKYVIFHATVDTDRFSQAFLEFSIRHEDGTPISSQDERERLIKCLQAASQRRAFEGVMFEMEAPDRRGLLADVTRTIKEEGLNVTGAEMTSLNQKSANVFYVTPHVAGNPVEPKTIEEAVRKKIGQSSVKLKFTSHRRLSLGSFARKSHHN